MNNEIINWVLNVTFNSLFEMHQLHLVLVLGLA